MPADTWDSSCESLAPPANLPETAIATHAPVSRTSPGHDFAVDEQGIVAAARSNRVVEGLTHTHYRYPARFSPILLAALIENFSDPGDLVLDPFVGGGTTLVEALASGRRGIGIDISTLAAFVAAAKTSLPHSDVTDELAEWARATARAISMRRPEPKFPSWSEAGYLRHLGSRSRWRLRKAVAQSVHEAQATGGGHLETLARCSVLRTSQWALDGRKKLPSIAEFRTSLIAGALAVAAGSRALVARTGERPASTMVLNRSAIGLDADERVRAAGPPRLIVTSPPYPGVHVLYHRWQVDGRKESATPFFIANSIDGSGESYYTMGGRKRPGLPAYFDQLGRTLASLARLADGRTTLVQVVAFAHPEWQLPRYLETTAAAGWTETGLETLAEEGDGRLWRDVPNRKWYADQRGRTSGAREVVLFHRLDITGA